MSERERKSVKDSKPKKVKVKEVKKKVSKSQARGKETKNIKTPSLDKLAIEAQKRYKGTVMIKGNESIPFSHMPFGVFTLDLATFGGMPEGHTSLIYGLESSRKTTTAIGAIKEAQKKYPNKRAVYIDAETHYDRDWFELNGVNVENLRVIQNLGLGEAYADMLTAVVGTGEASIIVLDSIPALIPKALLDVSAEDNYKIAARAEIVNRLYSRIITERQNLIRRGEKPTTVLLVNQLKQKIGGYAPNGVTPTFLQGGLAQLYLSYLSIRMRKPKITEAVNKETGLKSKVQSEYGFKLDKPKAGCSFSQGTFTIIENNDHPLFNKTEIDDIATVVKYAKSIGMIGGNGKRQTFMIFPDMFFSPEDGATAMSFMCIKLYENKYLYTLTKAVIIAFVRLKNKKPAVPYDGYLVGHTSKEIMPYVDKLIGKR